MGFGALTLAPDSPHAVVAFQDGKPYLRVSLKLALCCDDSREARKAVSVLSFESAQEASHTCAYDHDVEAGCVLCGGHNGSVRERKIPRAE